MIRAVLIAGAVAALGCLAAQAQEVPELEGAPGYQATQEQAARRAEIQKQVEQAQKKAEQQAAQKQALEQAALKRAAADKAKVDQARAEQAQLAKQAEAQKAEQARLVKQAEALKLQQAKLDARAKELAVEEQRLARLRRDVEAEQASRQAELARQREEATRQPTGQDRPAAQGEVQTAESSAVEPGLAAREENDETHVDRAIAPWETRRRAISRVDFDAAERSCMRVAQERAQERDFYSARYDGAPHFYQGSELELRGRMRLQDRRGYMLVDSVCEVGADGEAQRFAFLR